VASEYSLDAYDFELPESSIAQTPADNREDAKLLVLDRSEGGLSDKRFGELPNLLQPGDLLVLNDTRVFPARLQGSRVPGGGAAELLLVEQREGGLWEALARPGRRLKPGARISFGDGQLFAEIVDVLEDGRRVVRFESDEPFWDLIEQLGEPPLPPYIRRPEGTRPRDEERYQTVYARERGAVAAPTAGLHFTEELLARLHAAGIQTTTVTLHVGYGTFEPVRVDDLREHRVAGERYVIPQSAAAAIETVRLADGRVIAVGTTTTRALEHAAQRTGYIEEGAGLADLTIKPGYSFRAIDGMITNFHLPRSSLLVMVSTFARRMHLLHAYRHAVATGYRFYSYGDAMLIL